MITDPSRMATPEELKELKDFVFTPPSETSQDLEYDADFSDDDEDEVA